MQINFNVIEDNLLFGETQPPASACRKACEVGGLPAHRDDVRSRYSEAVTEMRPFTLIPAGPKTVVCSERYMFDLGVARCSMQPHESAAPGHA